MVLLAHVQASNSRIASTLSPGLVAVFIGGTNGVGEATVKAFAKYAREPRIYNVGRSQEAADRIGDECKALNPDAQYHFIKADTSLIHIVDEVCQEIKRKETAVNILFLTIGSLTSGKTTSEGLDYKCALTVHSRVRFITNVLPLIQRAPALRRVVSIFFGTKEGPVDTNDISGRNLSLPASAGHTASIVTCALEAVAQSAPDVAFVHEFPGFVKSGISRGMNGLMAVLKTIAMLFEYFLNIPPEEVGERHLFLATSARYPAVDGEITNGVTLTDELATAVGTTGSEGSGVYSRDWDGESAGPKVVSLLAGFRKDGTREMIWTQVREDLLRVTGVESV